VEIITNALLISSKERSPFCHPALLLSGLLGVAAAAPTNQPGRGAHQEVVSERIEHATPERGPVSSERSPRSLPPPVGGINGDSAHVLNPDNRYAYYYAEAANGAVWTGPFGPIYVPPRDFILCSNIGQTGARIVGLREVHIPTTTTP
jgi:hypothetical protein